MRRRIERVQPRVFRLPTETVPETDGTAEWSSTTMVLVELSAAGVTGIGYSYVDAAAAVVVRDVLAPCVQGFDAFAIGAAHQRMLHAIRNQGRPGIVACAISAVDVAMWDLKAKLLDLPLAELLGPVRTEVPVYASGGFTSTPLPALEREIRDYVSAGHKRVKIKIGREPAHDLDRVRVAAAAAGKEVAVMVDANGAYTRKQAITMAAELARYGVVYFEEPVSSDDLEGLRLVRDQAPLAIAAGEYAYDPFYVRRMLEVVDIQQADATRCLGITGFLQADALCDAYGLPLSSHCAPSLHLHAAAAAKRLVHVEQFRDHIRMERILFEGAPIAREGAITYSNKPGLGLELRREEAIRHGV